MIPAPDRSATVRAYKASTIRRRKDVAARAQAETRSRSLSLVSDWDEVRERHRIELEALAKAHRIELEAIAKAHGYRSLESVRTAVYYAKARLS